MARRVSKIYLNKRQVGMAFSVFTCSGLEPLAQKLNEFVSGSCDPFEQETVVVQYKAVQQWLQLELARTNGITANIDYPFPKKIISDLLIETGNPISTDAGWSWRIFDALRFCSEDKVRAYLADDSTMLKRWKLATRLSALFDSYQIYRAENLSDDLFWRSDLWQKELFEIARGASSAGEQILQFLEQIPKELPWKRLSFFGLTSLPPLYLKLLKYISEKVDIHFYVLAPEAGNESELIKSWGAANQEFVSQLEYYADDKVQLPFEPVGNSILSSLHEVLHSGHFTIEGEGSSVQVMSCHSPRREVEVLQQQILSLFEQNPDLQPEDVLVVAPDPDVYRAHIDAVFAQDHQCPIPVNYGVFDKNHDAVLTLYFELCRISFARITATDFMVLFSHPLIQKKLGVRAEILPVVRELVIQSHYCWGVDGVDKANRFGVPSVEQHTLMQMLDRVIMGMVLDDSAELFDGILPLESMTGMRAEAAVALWEFGRAIKITVDESRRFNEKNKQQKADFFRSVLERFIPETEDNGSVLAELYRSIGAIQDYFPEQVSLDVAITALEESCAKRTQGASISFSGGISMGSIRDVGGVPFKVVAVLGMNDGEFPSKESILSFDLMSGEHLVGDRRATWMDRGDFMRTVLSAKENLLLLYSGRNMKNSQKTPAAVPLAELTDFIQRNLYSDFKIQEHPMQPHSSKYFLKTGEFRSFSDTHFKIAQQLVNGTPEKIERFTAPLKREPNREVSPRDLATFISGSTEWFYGEILQARVPSADDSMPTIEPFALNGLEKYSLREEMISRQLQGDSKEQVEATLQARGVMPAGDAGAFCLDNDIAPVSDEILSALRGMEGFSCSDELLHADVKLENGWIRGPIMPLYNSKIISWQPGRLKAKSLLQVWVHHLILMCSGGKEPSLMLGIEKDEVVKKQFMPLDSEEALQHLNELLKLYVDGQQYPLPLFPETSYEFVSGGDFLKKWNDGKNWSTGEIYLGEGSEGSKLQIFNRVLPDGWQEIANMVITPMLETLTEVN